MDQHCLFGCSVHCLLSSIYQLFTGVGENLPLFLFLSFWKGVCGKGDGVLFSFLTNFIQYPCHLKVQLIMLWQLEVNISFVKEVLISPTE